MLFRSSGRPGRAALIAATAFAAIASVECAHSEVVFLDHRDKPIELESPPERLVSIIRAAPILYYSVDRTTDHIAGINEDSLKTFNAAIYGEIIPELLKLNTSVAREGFVPNVEAILALDPDLVIQWTFDPKIIEPLERVGLKVLGWGCCTEAERRDYVTMSGYVSGRIDRAQTMLRLQDESNAALREIFADTPQSDYVPILEVDQLGDQIRVVANSSQEYALSGVKNLASDDSGEWWRTIDAEQFLVWNPKIIIIPAWEPLQPADFYGNALLASVDAVKNKRVYKVPSFNRTPDAAEVYLTAHWLARIAHPERFESAVSFRQPMKDAYQGIYGKELTEAQLGAVLEVESNKDSAIYGETFD